MGLRFRLHRKDLPGRPDLVFLKHQLAVFVHDCRWHIHPHCSQASSPKSRTECRQTKFDGNVTREAQVAQKLEPMGWRMEVVWERETRDSSALGKHIEGIMDPASSTDDIGT
jgi:DNA mismatch endonuclease (patch repair protein)